MSTMSQVVQNLASADRSGVDTLSLEDLELVEEARTAFGALDAVRCTECRYCLPCSNGVDIPLNLQLFNRAIGLDKLKTSRFMYRTAYDPSRLASAQIEIASYPWL